MTDLPPRSPLPEPSGDEADLLASLYLDDEATLEERARVEADPDLMARVEGFRTIAGLTADVPVPDGLADIHIAAALDVFDAMGPVAAPSTVSVASLADRRARRSRLPAWLGAAAVSALVVGGLGFVATRGSGDDDEAASSPTSLSASASNADEGSDDSAAFESAEADLDQSGVAADAETEATMRDEEAAPTAGDAAEEAQDDAIEEDGGDQPMSPAEAADYYAANGPVDLGAFDLDASDGATAADYYDQLLDLPLQPIEASPCADSPLVGGLFGIDSFIPVVFDGQPASLVVQAGSASTALIVSSTCESALS